MLPNGYKEGITRVSDIVSFVFPFEGYDKDRYMEWLGNHHMDEDVYLSAAQKMGTAVHDALEHYILTGKKRRLNTKLKLELEHGINFLEELSADECQTEVYVREKNERFQGALDLFHIKEGTSTLADWKTFGICKKLWIERNMRIAAIFYSIGVNYYTLFPCRIVNRFTVPSKKKKKVHLQMSIYAYAMRQRGINIDNLQLLFLHEEGIKVVDMKPMSDDEIESVLDAYEASKSGIDNIKININNMFEIEILEPTKQYGNVKVKFNLEKIDNGKTGKENIRNACDYAKALANEMKI